MGYFYQEVVDPISIHTLILFYVFFEIIGYRI